MNVMVSSLLLNHITEIEIWIMFLKNPPYALTSDSSSPREEPDGKMYVKYQVIGKNHVAVPTHFFKVVILENRRGEVELRSYVMPNMPVDDKIPLERFLVPIESIERASGLLFVPNIMRRTNSLQAITAGGQ